MTTLTEEEARLRDWIDVSEFVPDTDRDVLIVTNMGADVAQAYYCDGKWYAGRNTLLIMMDSFNGDKEVNEIVEYWHEQPLHPKL